MKVAHLTSVHLRYDTRIYHKECISLSKRYDMYLKVADEFRKEVKENVSITDIERFKN